MIYAVMPKEDYEHACDVLREYTGEAYLIKSGDLEENIDKVYDAGEAAGEERGYTSGYSDGHSDGIVAGLEKTNSATATPAKVPEGETFWAGGRERTGTAKKALGGIAVKTYPAEGYEDGEKMLVLSHSLQDPTYISPDYGSIRLKTALDNLGDAERRDVVRGKIFTSKDGVVIEGTGEAVEEARSDGFNNGYTEGYNDGRNDPRYKVEPYGGGYKIIIG